MQEKKNPPKLENKNERNNLLCVKNERERERERERTFCVRKNYEQNGKGNCKFIVRGGEKEK